MNNSISFTVYVLYSDVHALHYTGMTSNISERLKSHNFLGRGWTSKYRPWKLIYTRIFDMRTEAMNHEKWLKSGSGREFVRLLPHKKCLFYENED